MIENFEQITAKLTDREKELVPVLIRLFNNYDSTNPIKTPKIIGILQMYYDIKTTGVLIRKVSNFIRSEGILPLIATSQGYYVSYNKEIVKSQIRSLKDRAEAILSSTEGLKKFAGDDKQLTLEL